MSRELSPSVVAVILAALLVLLIGGFFLMERQKRASQTQSIEKIIQRGVGAPPPSPK
ncbi:MAG: hypothetical protein ACUVTZ_11775 [Armatimonadota bacterium]